MIAALCLVLSHYVKGLTDYLFSNTQYKDVTDWQQVQLDPTKAEISFSLFLFFPSFHFLRSSSLLRVFVRAADGYEVLFALPELDPEFSARTIILAESVDGAALPAGTGPYRLVVPEEKKPARWIREVREIEIRFAK